MNGQDRLIRSKLQKADGGTIPIIWNVRKEHKLVLLCLHGFGGDKDSSVIAALMKGLDEDGVGVVTFDWPAHGESDAPDSELTVENCLVDLDLCVKVIRQVTGKEISCFATSFGGYIATLYRMAHPDAFLRLILRSPALKMAEVYRGLLTDEEYERLMQGGKIVQGFERKMQLDRRFYDSLKAHDAYRVDPPYPWNIMILQGDRDDVVDPNDIRAYAERYKEKKMRLEILEGTDHRYGNPGEKERVVELTKNFLEHFLHPEREEMREIHQKREARGAYLDQIRGSLLGGAVGDALGYPVEFMQADEIFSRYGAGGVREYRLNQETGMAHISDDTQMTLFTATGILVGETRGCLRGIQGEPRGYVYRAYTDWLKTQSNIYDGTRGERHESWLMDVPELYSRRAPGNTCLSALAQRKNDGKVVADYIKVPLNDSKGCGGVMRVAPLALYYQGMGMKMLDMEGAQIAAITHSHSLGYIPAAVLVHIINRIVYARGQQTLKEIVLEAMNTVENLFAGDIYLNELKGIVDRAIALSENHDKDLDNIRQLGEGWVAEETLGIAIYCSLKYQNDFSEGVIAAVNHSGDSDSTGAVTGNILGAWLGYEAIEGKWKEKLELADVILEIADDLCYGCMMSEYGSYYDPEWERKYVFMGKRT